jgi:phage repressor protein C with HTH and peptisase S24 domain
MKRILLAGFALLLLASCSNEPTLQKYYVEKGGNPGFVSLDIAPTFLDTQSIKLSPEETAALKSLHKFNVLVYKADSLDVSHAKYNKEKDQVKALVKQEYEELIKVNNGTSGASISTKGEGENIDEFVVFLHNQENGFGVVRVLGNDMTPNNVLTIAGLLQKAPINMEQLKPLEQLMTKK